MHYSRRLLLVVPLVLAAMSGFAHAQTIPLSELSTYLNSLRTAEGKFTQINADGTISTGTIYIKRPGRIRFEYDPPEEALVIAGGGSLAVFDPRSNSGADRYPLNQTPLSIVLANNVDLESAEMVVAHEGDEITTTVTAQDPDHPEYGSIKLVFTGDPVELRQWVITDNAGTETTVILGDMNVGGAIQNVLFNIIAAERRWAARQQ